ncbi:hypothetical protein KIPB_007494, partial [Kipferlia bialata]|eukprot:g7494.t1
MLPGDTMEDTLMDETPQALAVCAKRMQTAGAKGDKRWRETENTLTVCVETGAFDPSLGMKQKVGETLPTAGCVGVKALGVTDTDGDRACCMLGRTYLVDVADQDAIYKALHTAHAMLISMIVPGAAVADIEGEWHTALSQHEDPLVSALVPRLLACPVRPVNLVDAYVDEELCEALEHVTVRPNCALVVVSAATGVEGEDGVVGPTLQLLDTVVVAGERVKVVTTGVASDLESVAYKFEEEEEAPAPAPQAKAKGKSKATVEVKDEDDDFSAPEVPAEGDAQARRQRRRERVDRLARLSGVSVPDTQPEDGGKYHFRKKRGTVGITDPKRDQHQTELSVELLERLRKQHMAGTMQLREEDVERDVETATTRGPAGYPREASSRDIYVDSDARGTNSIYVPINGRPVPIHISCIRSVSLMQEDSSEGTQNMSVLRINLNAPGYCGKSNAPPQLGRYPLLHYITELTFQCRAHDSTRLERIENQIKQLKKRERAVTQAHTIQRGVIKQGRLETFKTKNTKMRLTDLVVKPSISTGKGRKCTGVLEAHANGFRFTADREHFDILYENVRYAFYHKATDSERVAIIHLHLQGPMIVGKTRTEDIQFMVDIGGTTTDIKTGWRRSNDDERHQEERDRQMISRRNTAFKTFIKSVLEILKQVSAETDQEVFTFQKHYHKRAFTGAAGKTTSVIEPTPDCLVSIYDCTPTFVLPLDDVQFVVVERFSLTLATCDLVFVYSDLRKGQRTIGSVNRNSLAGILDWLNECDIKYFLSQQSVNWTKMLKDITESPSNYADFIESGAWVGFFEPELMRAINGEDASDEESEAEQDHESSFAPDESDAEEDYMEDEEEYEASE